MSRGYRVLLLAFPRRVRREFGDDMALLFDAQLAAAKAAGRASSGFGRRAIVDAAVHGCAERLGVVGDTLRDFTREARRWRWFMSVLRRESTPCGAPGRPAAGPDDGGAVDARARHRREHGDFLRRRRRAPAATPVPTQPERAGDGVGEASSRRRAGQRRRRPADYVDWAKLNTTLEIDCGIHHGDGRSDRRLGEPVKLPAGSVSPAFFDVLRTRPQLGRTFRPEEGIVGNQQVVILGHGLWLRMLDPIHQSWVDGIMLSGGRLTRLWASCLTPFEFADGAIGTLGGAGARERGTRNRSAGRIMSYSSTLE